MWFFELIRKFFFSLDRIIYNFIPSVYDLLISIARTSVLTQADIIKMAERIYSLLAIFMVFKVTLSLITYVVNPDDFSDKSKGLSKLGTNIIISLSLLVLTPYIFRYAYQLQSIILKDNSLATLIFGKNENGDNFLNSAGEEMAYIAITPFFLPDTSIPQQINCIRLITVEEDGSSHFNSDCSGLDENYNKLSSGTDRTMVALTEDNDEFDETALKNYVLGVEKRNFKMMFRKEILVAQDGDKNFVIEYKYILSTIVGVVIILLLINFCMDVALRSIKLAFLQLIAPIPILSYVDPKSGKDGLFKKWYQMCFKTFASLFVRLLALYFALYIIWMVADGKMVDIIDGSYQTNLLIKIFIIIGALMFAKQLPKILEGLGIKLDGDGKFFLNPFKKFEEQALGGKRVTGALGGMAAGAVGGHGVFGRLGSALTGGIRGAATNKGYKAGLDRQADVNRKLREARINGAGFWGSRVASLSNRYGLDDYALEGQATRLRNDKHAIDVARREVDNRVKAKETEKKAKQDSIHENKRTISDHKRMQEAISKMEERAKSEIQNGNGGSIGRTYLEKKATAETYEKNIGKMVGGTLVTAAMAASARQDANKYLNDIGMKQYMTQAATGVFDDGSDDKTFQNSYKTYRDSALQIGYTVETAGSSIHTQYGTSKGTVGDIERAIAPTEREISDLEDQIRNIQVQQKVRISGESAEISLEEAENIIKEREQKLKDKQDQNKLNRETAKNRRIGS